MCLGLLGVLAAVTAQAGPLDWLERKLGAHQEPEHPPATVSHVPLELKTGEPRRIRFGHETPHADLPSGPVQYVRFGLDKPVEKARLSLSVIAERHDGTPRYTVFSPQIVILDDDGQIRRIVPMDHLQLDIRPFQPTQLRQCIIVDRLQSFLLASDPGRLGHRYQFDARPRAASHPDHGFYRPSSPMKVFLPYADTGPVEIRVTPAPKEGSTCQRVPG